MSFTTGSATTTDTFLFSHDYPFLLLQEITLSPVFVNLDRLYGIIQKWTAHSVISISPEPGF